MNLLLVNWLGLCFYLRILFQPFRHKGFSNGFCTYCFGDFGSWWGLGSWECQLRLAWHLLSPDWPHSGLCLVLELMAYASIPGYIYFKMFCCFRFILFHIYECFACMYVFPLCTCSVRGGQRGHWISWNYNFGWL